MAYNTWKTSTHANNPQGVVADCMDCHLPNPHNTFDFFYKKTYHGLKDVILHFTTDTSEYDHEKNRQAVYEDMTNDRCRKCHRFFDEHLEVAFYELWHHEGRRARMGAAMMGPDYTWWHGFYELKHTYNKFMTEANELLESGEKAHRYEDFPGDTGNRDKPEEIFGPEAK